MKQIFTLVLLVLLPFVVGCKDDSKKSRMLTLTGEGVSPGLAKGRAFVYIDVLKRDAEFYKIDDAHIENEKAGEETR